jgi:hypothetical protein
VAVNLCSSVSDFWELFLDFPFLRAHRSDAHSSFGNVVPFTAAAKIARFISLRTFFGFIFGWTIF